MGVMKDRKMARKPAKPRTKSSSNYDLTFVDVTLTTAQKTEFKTLYSSSLDSMWGELGEVIQSGYKLGVTYYDDGDCYIATLMSRDEADPNYGKMLSARSDVLAEAMLLLVFKHLYVVDKCVWPDKAARENWG